jgi:primosomal protein N' (replication factor Y)
VVREAPKEITLTPEQEAALQVVGGGVTLIHGVTGSGKTEVYLRAIERVVAAGRQAIVLVPEIALTPQTVSRFKARFPRIAVLHSVLTEADRAAQWRATRSGEADVIIGARSAIFAPTRALGLVVVDEEHEGAYKQENAPRYHAREVAIERARREGAGVVLGSATPSLESLHRARSGEFRLARLPYRIERREMPEIEVVDMIAERAELKRYPILSRRLSGLMAESLGRGEQVILFLNRRGFVTQISCPRCHWVFRCRRCDVALTYHRQDERGLCHYCYEARPVPETCPDCTVGGLLHLGIGTERIEDEVKSRFPDRVVARMDSDAMKTKKDYRESLTNLWSGKMDILIGTQMIAKGLDVPNVTLVGVVNADTAFHVPDFRAAERTFQLITQVAGRAGRGPRGGRVVVQSFNPNHYSITSAAAYDFDGFVARELEMRKELGYPPFAQLVRIVVQGTNEKRTREAAERFATKLRPSLDGSSQLLGPAPAPLYRLKGRWRMHLLVKTPDASALRERLMHLAGAVSRPLQAIVDVDPVGMM